MTKQYKTNSRSALARELLSRGVKPKDVAKRTGLSQQTIYTVKWKMANKQGLGAIKPKTPPVAQGTGITSVPLEFQIIDRPAKKQSNARRNAQLARRKREREEREANAKKYWNTMIGASSTALVNHMIKNQIKPVAERTLWQRIKGFFVGA